VLYVCFKGTGGEMLDGMGWSDAQKKGVWRT
jgi:hypothetical protein